MKNAHVLSRSITDVGAVQFLVHVPDLYLGEYEYVVVSAVSVPHSGPETYLFPSDQDGDITDWGELPGSQRGTLDTGRVLLDAGLRVTRFDPNLLEILSDEEYA